MNEELLIHWFNEAEREYDIAVSRDDIYFPRDIYLALHIEKRVRDWNDYKLKINTEKLMDVVDERKR